jgi:heme-degrading monooxygenase HmoA
MMDDQARRPAIARIWRGRVAPERADAYEDYNYREGILPLIEKAMGVQTFREDRDGETEFITISYWENEAAMAAFAGDDPRAIHHLPEDKDWLIELPDRVQIVRLRHVHGIVG